MYKFYKIMFLFTLVFSSFLTISSYSWMVMWMGLEINLMSIIPIMKNEKNMFPSESALKYFMTQVMASSIMLFSFMMMDMFNELEMSLNFLYISLLIKMGVAPFHFWFPEVIEGINWINCLIMMTWQKLAPMVILLMLIKNSSFINMSIIMSSIISGILGLNQNSIRKIMAYSSINHSAWMMISMLSYSKLWMIYFVIYSLMNMSVIYMFNKVNCFFINQFKMLKLNTIIKICFMLNFFSLSGLPPFIGFLPKWLTIFFLVNTNNILMMTVLILTTLFSVYMYLRLMLSFLLLLNKETLLINKFNFSQMFLLLNFLFLLSLPIFSLFI